MLFESRRRTPPTGFEIASRRMRSGGGGFEPFFPSLSSLARSLLLRFLPLLSSESSQKEANKVEFEFFDRSYRPQLVQLLHSFLLFVLSAFSRSLVDARVSDVDPFCLIFGFVIFDQRIDDLISVAANRWEFEQCLVTVLLLLLWFDFR
ncbi:hypothetical protein KFK09_004539 [Dendrobium nobile]|uniref:Uncharacterized protein n=1 Tax=Dendrobium nobile TaxID=94219 RepID=A0A8T3C608_DENNO|nr:hypothetical protein KFK09_004539 [Dendrobium nobile]